MGSDGLRDHARSTGGFALVQDPNPTRAACGRTISYALAKPSSSRSCFAPTPSIWRPFGNRPALRGK